MSRRMEALAGILDPAAARELRAFVSVFRAVDEYERDQGRAERGDG